LERSYKYKNHCFLVYRNDKPVAICPFYEACNKIAKENGLYFILITTLSDLTKDHFSEYNPLPFPVGGNMMLNLEENSPDKIWN
jgi:hypothetical protein